MARVTFYFDLGSPYSYLAAERLYGVIVEPVRWQPVLLGGLFKLTGRSSWAAGDAGRRARGMAEIERRAQRYGLPPVRWPDPWPADYLAPMRATTYAFTAGAGEAFTLAAYRIAFRDGRQLDEQGLGDAARAAGLDPAAVIAATVNPEIKRALRAATDAAYDRGVLGVPTFAAAGELFWGDDRLEEVASHLSGVVAP